MSLAWTASTTSTVVEYRVYYGTAPRTYLQAEGAGIRAGNSTAYSVTGLTKGVTYYFAVTAVDATGNESAYSNEGSKVAQ